MNGLLNSIIHRPYVFVFLAAYIFLAWRSIGLKKTLFWLVSAYFLAWASEYSSIHNGFPYGEYHYVYGNLKNDLLILGVPFFDSLSYVFLTFAGYAIAEYILARHKARDTRLDLSCVQDSRLGSRVLGLIFCGALLTTLLDIIIDPIATMGSRWFLGQIHYYAYPGFYFGVPLSNFAGWFITSIVIITFNVGAWQIDGDFLLPTLPFVRGGLGRGRSTSPIPSLQRRGIKVPSKFDILYPIFYAGIALFSIVISYWVGQWRLGIASSVILLLILGSIFRFFPRLSLYHRT